MNPLAVLCAVHVRARRRRHPRLSAYLARCTLLAAAMGFTVWAHGETDPAPPALVLSLADAFEIALRHNQGVRAAILDSAMADAEVMQARGEFDPTLSSALATRRTQSPPTEPLDARDPRDTRNVSLGLRQRLLTGTEIGIAASSAVTDDPDAAALNPRVQPDITLRASQDLLRGWGVAVNRGNIDLARNRSRAAQKMLRQVVIDTLAGVETAYWELRFAESDLQVRRAQIERANHLVARAEARVRIGEAAPIEIVRAEASAARQAVAILEAENAQARLQHRLLQRLGIAEPTRVRTTITLTDTPETEGWRPTMAESLALAQAARPELARAHLARENARIAATVARNQTRPRLRWYGEVGIQGLDDSNRDAVASLREGDGHHWEIGLIFEYPIGNRTARAQRRIATLEHERAGVTEAALIENITREVADAVIDLHRAADRIDTARRAAELAARLLEAEEKSFNLGRSDSLEVLNAQSSLAAAERDWVRAQTDHAIAAIGLLRVQGNLLEARNVQVP